MQFRGDKHSRIFLILAVLIILAMTVLYFMKRSETNSLREDLKVHKKQSMEVEEALNQKITEMMQKMKMLEQQMSNYKTQLNKCEDQLLVGDKEIDTKDKQLSECNKEREENKKVMATHEEEVQHLKESVSKTQADFDKLQSTMKTLQEELSTCREKGNIQVQPSECQASLQLTTQNLKKCMARCGGNLTEQTNYARNPSDTKYEAVV